MAREVYIDQDFYSTEYEGQAIPADTFDQFAKRASEALDQLTLHRVRRAGMSAFSTEDQESIKLATCALAEGLYLEDQATDSTGVVRTQESVGGAFSTTVEAASIKSIRLNAQMAALQFLLYTGLGYTGSIGL